MEKLTKDNIYEFMDYYHYLHDSSINKIDFNPNESKIEAIFDIYWSGKPITKKDGSYDTHKTKIRMIFTGIDDFKDDTEYNYIDDTLIDCYKKNGKDLIRISLKSPYPDEPPYLCITCEKIEYEIIKI